MLINNILPTTCFLAQNDSETSVNNRKSQYSNVLNSDKKIIYTTVGLIGLSTLWMLRRTSYKNLSKVANKEFEYLKVKDRKNYFKNFKIESLENNNSIQSLDDLSGLEEIKTFINKKQILTNNKEIAKDHNVESFNSLLLWGVPGTGKTSAAMGIAKKLNADFVRLDKEIFDSEFISRGPRQLAECFREIKEYANSNPKKNIVVFMDEIDSTMAIDKGIEAKQDDVMVNTLKQGITDLQRECDNILFIGATNKDPNGLKSDNTAVRLNTAILSRFNYQFEMDLPEAKHIKEAWEKLVRTQSGKEKFTSKQNDIIAQKFHELGMSYRDIKNVSNKINIEDAVEFCKTHSYNSSKNLINVLKNDEKIGYDPIKKFSMSNEKKAAILEELNKQLSSC